MSIPEVGSMVMATTGGVSALVAALVGLYRWHAGFEWAVPRPAWELAELRVGEDPPGLAALGRLWDRRPILTVPGPAGPRRAPGRPLPSPSILSGPARRPDAVPSRVVALGQAPERGPGGVVITAAPRAAFPR
ncbi:MAG: hypothetical protein ACRDVM_05315 [Acidimicrobiia bacterium]